MLVNRFLLSLGSLFTIFALAAVPEVAADWRSDLRTTVAPIAVDLGPDKTSAVDLQLLYKDPNSTARKRDSQSPFNLFVVATDERDQRNRALAWYQLVELDWQRQLAMPLTDTINMLQVVSSDAANENYDTKLMAYADGTVSRLNPETRTFTPVRNLASIYRASAIELDTDIAFTREVTSDERADLLVPDFAGWRFSAANADGSFAEPQLFGPKPLMNMGSARYVNVTAHTPYVFDHNRDGRMDVAFWEDDALQVYLQQPDAIFATTATRLDVAPEIGSDAFFSLSVGTDEDNPTGRQVLLDAIEDLDADGLPDMVVYAVSGEGLFGKETRYEIHRGVLDAANRLAFETEASSLVGSAGIQISAERLDLNGDGTLEMMVTSFDLGLGSIVRALLSRTANLQLAIYEMEEGRYSATPVLTRKVTAKLDISNGDVFVPAVLAADINGDGLKDLLVQDGDNRLKVFAGENSKTLFSRTATNLAIELPESEGDIRIADLDGDEKDDLLIMFAADKALKQPSRIHAVRFLQGK